MCFYDILQMDPQVLKPMIQKTSDKHEQRRLKIGMALRSLLIVLFAILFIAPMTWIFGSDNSPMAVAIFCILLGVRFVDFGCCIRDGLISLATVFLLLLTAPVLAATLPPLLALMVHFLSFFTILFLTCHRPEMGNGGLYSFAYIYLSGNPVFGTSLLLRSGLTLLGLLLCGTIFYVKHKDKNLDVSLSAILKNADWCSHHYQWEIRMALGVSLMLTAGVFLGIERFMWAGFACGSLLSDYSESPKIVRRSAHRFIGAVAGSLLFYFLYILLPEPLHTLIGPLGGFCMGFCTDYRFKTAVNCFGALILASGLYGTQTAVYLRIADTLIGILFALCFYGGMQWLSKKLPPLTKPLC